MIPAFAFALFCAATILGVVGLFRRKPLLLQIILLAVIFLLAMGELVRRSIILKIPAMTNTFEAILFFSAMINLVIILYYIFSRRDAFLIFITSFISYVIFTLAFSPLISDALKPPIPALRSGWLFLHVSLTFVGEAFFAFAFGASVYYLVLKDEEKKKRIDKIIYHCIIAGYPLFTAGGLLFGAIWAHSAWGRLWGWDPKEIFSLVTFLVYTIYLHLKAMSKTANVYTVYVSILGFLLAIFTFFGVNFLLPGLHSYR
ncbi:MAG TPA: cytochrome C biogenesis protein [Spirochaetia bacterium]|nr:cytochrome C biogenesis protein [Spirochaetia bacterium]